MSRIRSILKDLSSVRTTVACRSCNRNTYLYVYVSKRAYRRGDVYLHNKGGTYMHGELTDRESEVVDMVLAWVRPCSVFVVGQSPVFGAGVLLWIYFRLQ